MIPYGKHFLDQDDIDAVINVLRHGWLTQGPRVQEFEEHLAEMVDAQFAVAVSSATAALHLCCIASDLKQDDIVITSANTFVASANCAEYVGARAEFCDIDEETLNISPQALGAKAIQFGGFQAVIPVHFAGVAADMVSISKIAKKYKAVVIEDASHALGAQYETGHKVGSCFYSDMTVFSLHPVKGVTAGEGGVITTNCEKTYKRLLQLRSHGILKGNFDIPGIGQADGNLVNRAEAIDEGELNPWYYEMQELGFNYRITDIQCALANSQLNKLRKFMDRRKLIAQLYDQKLENVQHVNIRQSASRELSSHHLYVVEIDFESVGISRKSVMQKLVAEGYGSQVHYIPVPMQPYYQNLGHRIEDYPIAEAYYRKALSIPIYYELTDPQACGFVEELTRILKKS